MEDVDRKVTVAELREHLTGLAREVDATRQHEGFTAALRTMAQFWSYSPTNLWLIRRACPHATRVAGRRTWARLGRVPKQGATPITVLAPTRNGFPFIAVPVYDVSQTEGAPLAALDLTLAGDDGARVRELEHAARMLGVEVVEQRIAGHELGTTVVGESRGGTIVLAPGLVGLERCAVIAHELGHEILHQGERSRRRPRSVAERETEAEATSFVVMAALGMPSKAPAYIAWRGGSGKTVLASMVRVQRAARRILEATRRSRPFRAAVQRSGASSSTVETTAHDRFAEERIAA